MQNVQSNPDLINAAEPIVRFVSKKMAYDEISLSALERATAKRAVEAAAWSVCVMPETADILNDSPAVRAEMLKLLDLEQDEGYFTSENADGIKAQHDFADSIKQNPRLFIAVTALAPELALRIGRLAQ